MFLKPSESVEFIVLKIAEGDDGAVLTERLDKFALGGKNIELPVMGVFELTGGKIAAPGGTISIWPPGHARPVVSG